jgi:mono/diheme cytochrome c family protein
VPTRIAFAFAALLAAGCSGGEGPELSQAAQRGKATYMNVCVACHSADPGEDGTLGPNLAGATRELIEWRVVRGAYPPGYTPKRSTGAMPAFPHLADKIDDLHAFVSEATRGSEADR